MKAEPLVVEVVNALTGLQKLHGLDLGQVQLIFMNGKFADTFRRPP
jgi:hypothetical protein